VAQHDHAMDAASLQSRCRGRSSCSCLVLLTICVPRDMLVGTEGGALHVLRVEEKEKRERTWAPLLQLDGTDTNPVRGCHQQVGPPWQPCRACAALVFATHGSQTTVLAAQRRSNQSACVRLLPYG